MTNFIPIFPLGIVVYPGEDVNLHIFEPRYKALINDINNGKKQFGIPAVINNKVCEMGTLVQLKEITKVYDNGEMDIKTSGIKVFKILEMIKTVPDKLYSGAIVHYPANKENGNGLLTKKVLAAIRQLHEIINVSKDFKKPDEQLCSYDIAHHAGMSLQQEYELLELLQEVQRIEYLKRHLVKVLPVVTEMETLKSRIKLNGHFKNLGGFNI
ncbi:MAG: hypothetical protein RL172_928 [Bacteroidota bacterium]|jgi:Lon protease-like protein